MEAYLAFRNLPIRLLLTLASLLAPAALLVILWAPAFLHYRVATPNITDATISRAREFPADAVLEELSRYYFFSCGTVADTAAFAERVLEGEVNLPGLVQRFHFPFDPDDLKNQPVVWQLFLGRLCVPRMLIAAYHTTGHDKFLAGARDAILGWADYESQALLPKGLLWNDHAIAERVQVLAEFWLLYRHHQLYNAAVALRVLRFAARSGEFLADSSKFTATTNHGAMQNLALLHLSLAFPTLPDAPRYPTLAQARLQRQLDFYISGEGVVLEHSAGYQRFGVQVLGTALRLFTLAEVPAPPAWDSIYVKAKAVYALLRRPDGSLPLYGDTEAPPDSAGPLVARTAHSGKYPPLERNAWRPGTAAALFPVAGYSVWWNGLTEWPSGDGLAQTVVTWSNFPSQVHKHADELSVLFWAAGQTWWTSVGYWPYDDKRADGQGWNGSNAPHLKNEAFSSSRTVRLLQYRDTAGVRYLDLERAGPDAFVARRQVLDIAGRHWIVLDHTYGSESDTSVSVWHTATEVVMRPGNAPGSFALRQAETDTIINAWFIGAPTPALQLVRGSWAPFAGWQVTEVLESTWAIIREQPAESAWSVAVWSAPGTAPNDTALASAPVMVSWQGPDRWHLALALPEGSLRVIRTGDTVVFAGQNRGLPSKIELSTPASAEREIAAIHGAYARMAAGFPRFHAELPYRIKVTYVFLTLLVFQELTLAAWRRIATRPDAWLRLTAVASWMAVGAYFLIVRVRLI